MQIVFHKLTNTMHRLEILRERGPREALDLETRSFLLHDFMHFAVESEAESQAGFWGQLAKGKSLVDMKGSAAAEFSKPGSELAMIEKLVGTMHGLSKGQPAHLIFRNLMSMSEQAGTPLPDWLNEDSVIAIAERLRKLNGQWQATPFGATMTLVWES